MNQYWAAKPTDDVGKEIMSKVEEYGEYMEASGLLTQLRNSYDKFYGESTIKSTGAQGELSAMRVNHYASLIRSIHTQVTSQRPAWEPRAANTDVKSQKQCILATGLLDYYAREKRMERYIDQATLTALFLREAWVSTEWDVQAGDVYSTDPETQQPVMEGDIKYKTYRMNEVVRDINKDDSDHNWLIYIDHVNKYDEAAKFPDLADRIIGLNVDKQKLETFRLRPLWTMNDECDIVPKYTLVHRKTAALPNGRMIVLFASDIVTFDGSLPYRRLPLRQITAEEMLESAFGHSPAFDLLPLQDALDTIFSTILTNQKAFGVQNVMVPKGSDVSVSSISGGLNLIEYDSKLGPPAPLNLTQTPKEVFEFAQLLVSSQETLSGQNSVARGNASPQLSGAAMALLQATALQFSSGVQKAHTRLVEDVGTDTIHIIADYAATKRVAYIVGKHNRAMQKAYSGEDVAEISRVTVDSANALTKSIAGRTEIANQLLQAGMVQRPEQYLMLIQTGQLEPMYENETSHLLLIRQENEDLAEGKNAISVMTDKHWLHIPEHMSVLDSPEARQDPAIVQSTLAHIQEHINLWQAMPPEIAMLLNAPAPPQAMPPQGGPAPGVPDAMNAQPPVIEQAGDVPLPNMPTDPMTGEPAQPLIG